MKAYSEAMYWKTNKKWYRANYDTDSYELTPLAPPRAVASFKKYENQNRSIRSKGKKACIIKGRRSIT